MGARRNKLVDREESEKKNKKSPWVRFELPPDPMDQSFMLMHQGNQIISTSCLRLLKKVGLRVSAWTTLPLLKNSHKEHPVRLS